MLKWGSKQPELNYSTACTCVSFLYCAASPLVFLQCKFIVDRYFDDIWKLLQNEVVSLVRPLLSVGALVADYYLRVSQEGQGFGYKGSHTHTLGVRDLIDYSD